MTRAQGPSACAVCGVFCHASICADCRARCAPPRWRCARCGLATGRAQTVCGDCVAAPPPFASTVCAVDYGFPWAGLVQAFKYHAQLGLAHSLASLFPDAGPAPGLWVPVPLTRERLKARGYNQAALLAQALAQRFAGRCLPQALWRVSEAGQQAAASRSQRLQQLAGAYMANPKYEAVLAAQAVALVDDVMTTGATVRAAAAALQRAGAAEVHCWVFARTPAPAAD
jgi:ComF family protein